MTRLTLIGALLWALLPSYLSAQADDCSSASSISGLGNFAFTTSGTSTDGPSACGNIANDAWFTWTAPTTESFTFSTCGAATYDTVLVAYSGGCGSLAQLACNDDTSGCSGNTSRISFSATAGQSYLIRIGGYNGATGTGTLTVSETGSGGGGPDDCDSPATGPDVIVGDLTGPSNYAGIGGVGAYAIGTTSCNIGTAELLWIAGNTQHPVIGQNIYRHEGNTFEMLGMSWLKHGFTALQQNLCCDCNSSGTGSRLGVGCSDPYSSGLNGSQSGLGPRWQVNAYTGGFAYPYDGQGATGNSIFKRIQVQNSDLDPALHPNATIIGEAQYITPDDSAAGNGLNNVSYRRMSVGAFTSGRWTLAFSAPTVRQDPAIRIWPLLDANVELTDVLVPNEGMFIVGNNATDNGDGTWHYEYAVYNMNNHASGGSFSVPVPSGVTVTNIGFRDVDYHSGEPFDGTDWVGVQSGGSVTWSTDSFATNQDANAIRWGTLYNFRFDADTAPTSANATLGLFRPHTPNSVQVAIRAPQSGGAGPDCDGDGIPDANEPDCDNDGTPDDCEDDCDNDGTPDDCEPDCGGNGVPDDCEPDCDGDGLADDCELDCDNDGTPDDCEADCDSDGTPDDCEPDCNGDGTPDDCEPDCDNDGTPDGCEDDCDGDGTPDDCEPDCDNDGTPDDCEPDCDNNGTPDDCESDCDGDGTPDACEPDCNGDGLPDDCAPDCNGDGTPDDCEPDCDNDGLPDGCEADCNGDGTPDDCDTDCDGDGTPDGCESDCNGDGTPDDCEGDCDGDGTPDGCESDCNGDGTPDDCEADCDGDGTPDGCESDCNGDGTPDDCEPDCDGDGTPDGCEDDCDGDGTPDDCEDDCDGDGTPDDCENDCDGDGTPDDCEDDCDSDGTPDDCEPDCDGDGTPDDCEADCNNDGTPDDCDGDCDGDGTPDGCEPDCDGDGLPDDCEDDCDNDGTPDDCEPDCDTDGVPDDCEPDCDGDDVPDDCEADCDNDGIPDDCGDECVAQDPTDDCNLAPSITGEGVFAFSNVGATTDGPAACGQIGSDVWFSWTADSTGDHVFSTCNDATYDTVLAAYTGDCANLVEVACNDDGAGCSSFSSLLPLFAVSGETFLIRIGGYQGDTGTGNLTITNNGFTITADDCTSPASVSGLGDFQFSTVGATTDGPAACGFLGSDVWLEWTAPYSVNYTLSTCDAATYDTTLAVYTGTCTSLTEVVCNDDGTGCSGFSSLTDFDGIAGTTYLIRIGGYQGASGSGTLTISWTDAGGPLDCNANGIPDAGEPDCDGDGTPDDCEADCDSDGTPDDCEADCNGDGTPDDCDGDCDGDGTPDGCEPDCDGDGTPDDCENDCNGDGTPDDCEADCDNDGTPDPCEPDCDGDGTPDDCEADCDNDGTPDDCELDCNADGTPDDCEPDCDNDGTPDPCEPDCDGDGTPDDCEADCDNDGTPDDCEPDCDMDGTPDDCELDCNGDGTPDDCESDCDGDGLPDECEPDCDMDGTPDDCETDCDGDGTPDECEPDCDGDGTPDDCEPDCNGDGTPDDCELDCDSDGLPDECEPDCDMDGTPDDCEPDCDGDGTPDECEPDCNGDGTPDDCEPDCDGDGTPDVCEDDCDGDGTPDACEPDCDGDGTPDDCEADCDSDGTPDDCEDDCDFDGTPDDCELDSDGDGIPDDCLNDCTFPEGGSDLIVGELTDVVSYDGLGGVGAYALGTTICNVGTTTIAWDSNTNQHPLIAQNVYRFENGVLEQIGKSWAQNPLLSSEASDCCNCAAENTGDTLGLGCSVPLSGSALGDQKSLAARGEVDAFGGSFTYPFAAGAPVSTGLDRRLQIANADLDPSVHAGATVFGESHVIAADDAQAGNGRNNVSWRAMTVGSFSNGSWDLAFSGDTSRREPAIRMWPTLNPNAQLTDVAAPGEGLFIVGNDVTDNGDGTWHYEYAVYNLDSSASGGSFSVPVPSSVEVTNIGFKGVDRHSGDPTDDTDWFGVRNVDNVTWSTDSVFLDPNANALGWGTLFNFRFDAAAPPGSVMATLGLFQAGFGSVSAAVRGPECVGVLAYQTIRVGSPANPLALMPSSVRPLIGTSWAPMIDHGSFYPDATLDALAVQVSNTTPLNVPTGLGTILCAVPASPFIFFAPASFPFSVPLPDDCSIVGLQACCQGASLGGAEGIRVTNALDIRIGNM